MSFPSSSDAAPLPDVVLLLLSVPQKMAHNGLSALPGSSSGRGGSTDPNIFSLLPVTTKGRLSFIVAVT
eukprot:scaffold71_cov265-Chaetoceros_neogracile.AAC.29